MTVHPFDPLAALGALHEGGVRFVLIGGLAGRLWGSPTITNDLDLCYARDAANLEALARVLRDLGARLRGAPDDLPFLLDARTLAAGDHFTFTTRCGGLDVLGNPVGSQGFESLLRGATRLDLEGLAVWVASLDDLIRMKKAAGRPKDLIEVEILAAVKEERRKLQKKPPS